MSEEPPEPKKKKHSPLLLSVLCASGIASGATFFIQKQNADQQISSIMADVAEQKMAIEQSQFEKDALIQQKEAQIQREREAIQEKLSLSAEQYQEKYQTTTSELSSTLQQKESKINTLKKDLNNLNEENLRNRQLWRASLMTSLEITQDVYAMKWQTNNSVLSDMENTSARTLDVTEKWEELITKLSPHTELAPQVAKLRIRLAQAYSGLGLVEKINLKDIDWQAAKLEEQKSEIEARLWFSLASNYSNTGKLKEAKEYLDKAKEIIPQMTTTPDKATYYSAMMNLLEAEIIASKKPAESLNFYNKAVDDLSEVVTAIPSNTKLRTAFIQACLDGALLSEAGSSAGQAEKLRKRAFASINTLLEENPKLKKPNLLYAEIKILEAEKMLRDGEQFKASELLTLARTHIKKGGGSILLTAEADSSKAFIHWDHGERTKAMQIIDSAIAKVVQFKKSKPKNLEADYRLASLHWVRSSMQLTPTKSIADGQKSVEYLLNLVKQGAGKREASSRRMVAIIYGDIGYQAATSGQKKIAKQYFEQALQQWIYLTKNWGGSDEYAEGERWCQWKIKEL